MKFSSLLFLENRVRQLRVRYTFGGYSELRGSGAAEVR